MVVSRAEGHLAPSQNGGAGPILESWQTDVLVVLYNVTSAGRRKPAR